MSQPADPPVAGSPDPEVAHLLRALADFTAANQGMRRRLSAEMKMNLTDVQALRHVIRAEQREGCTTPRSLALYLGISTAATTKLVDRLTDSGHLVRNRHPSDRRSVVITATPHARAQVRERLRHMHDRMRRVAEAVPERSRPDLITFLAGMTEQMTLDGAPALTPPTAGAPRAGTETG